MTNLFLTLVISTNVFTARIEVDNVETNKTYNLLCANDLNIMPETNWTTMFSFRGSVTGTNVFYDSLEYTNKFYIIEEVTNEVVIGVG